MIILTIRTDKPEAEIGLFKGQEKIAYETWQAHRELSVTIHKKIKKLLESCNKDWKDVEGIVVYKGPGSFTGLRIGFSVANTFAYAQNIPIVSDSSESWMQKGIARLQEDENEKIALPEYGEPAKTTQPRK